MTKLLWLLLLPLLSPASAQNTVIPQATQTERVIQKNKILAILTPENYDLTRFPSSDLDHWRAVLWNMSLAQPTDALAQQALISLLDQAAVPQLGPEKPTLVMALRVASSLYTRPVQPSTREVYSFIRAKLQRMVTTSQDTGIVALALALLARDGQAPVQLIKDRFPFWFMDTQLRLTLEGIALPPQPQPPLQDLLAHQVARMPHLYVLCRADRSIPCLALLKDGEGRFYQTDGNLWSLPLLAQSIYPLDWNFSNGETPQGLMRLEGVIPRTPAEFRAFGQFPSLKVFLPQEPGAKQFIPSLPGTTSFDLAIYRTLWPASWQNYRPIEESFWAGRLGRTLIRIHGSGENPELFYGQPTDLPNPTVGCIAAQETYDQNGQLVRADLPQLLTAWNRIQPGDLKNLTGYLFLIEIPGAPTPVTLEEIRGNLPPR